MATNTAPKKSTSKKTSWEFTVGIHNEEQNPYWEDYVTSLSLSYVPAATVLNPEAGLERKTFTKAPDARAICAEFGCGDRQLLTAKQARDIGEQLIKMADVVDENPPVLIGLATLAASNELSKEQTEKLEKFIAELKQSR